MTARRAVRGRDKRDTVPIKCPQMQRSVVRGRDKRDTVPIMATVLAIWLAGTPAWGHTFPPVHTVVVQVERCELALLIGYTAGTGESTERVVARAVSQPKPRIVGALRDTLAAYAMAPLTIAVDGVPLVARSLRAKIGLDAGGTRPIVVVLATFSLRAGRQLVIESRDPRTTRISWQDRGSGRVIRDSAPAEGHWFTGMASFLLPLAAATGGPSCARSLPSDSSASADSSDSLHWARSAAR